MQENENPPENNNFETIISTWRRFSGELIEAPAFTSMSGDSSSHPFKKKEEDSNLLALERPKGPIATAASAGAAVVAANDKTIPALDNTETNIPDEKQELTKQDKEETKEAAGDANFDNDKESRSFLENDSDPSKFTESKNPKDRGDKVDSIYLRPPPPHKVRSNASTTEDEDCGIKCLYYTLQCCDCVLIVLDSKALLDELEDGGMEDEIYCD